MGAAKRLDLFREADIWLFFLHGRERRRLRRSRTPKSKLQQPPCPGYRGQREHQGWDPEQKWHHPAKEDATKTLCRHSARSCWSSDAGTGVPSEDPICEHYSALVSVDVTATLRNMGEKPLAMSDGFACDALPQTPSKHA